MFTLLAEWAKWAFSPSTRNTRPTTQSRLHLESLEERALLSGTPTAGPTPLMCGCPFCTGAGQAAQSANFQFTTGSASTAGAAKWSQPGGLGSTVTITYSFNNILGGGLGGGMDAGTIRASIEEALSRWAAVAPLRFVEVPDSGPALAANMADYSAAGRPMLRFGTAPIDGQYNTLAYAYYPGGTGLAGDLFFDSTEKWSNNPTRGIDLIEVAIHEIGHTLGLGHEPMPSSGGNLAVMNPYYGRRFQGPGTSFLYNDDVNGIRALYGAGVGAVVPINSTALPPVKLPFADSFAAGQLDSGAWQGVAGDFQVSGGRASSFGADAAVAVLRGASAAAAYAEASVDLSSGGMAGLYTRMGPGGWYRVEAARSGPNTVLTLAVFTPATGIRTLAAKAVAGALSGTLRLETVGNTQRVYFGGALVCSAADASLPAAGTVGMRALGGASLDDFRAAEVAATASLPFADSFAAGQLDSGAWQGVAGNFQVAGGRASGAGADAAVAVLRGASAAAEYAEASVDLSSGPGGMAGLYTRMGSGGWYRVEAVRSGANTVLTLAVFTPATGIRTLATRAVAGALSGTLRLETVGNTQRVYFGGALVCSAADASLQAAGTVGMRAAGGASLDDFRAAEVAATASLPFADSFAGGQLDSGDWQGVAGNFQVAGGRASSFGADAAVAVLRGASAAAAYAEASVDLSSGGMAGLYTRMGPGGWYRVEASRSGAGTVLTLAVFTPAGGVRTLATRAVAGALSGTLRLETVGNTQRVYFGGALVCSAADASLPAAGTVGMRALGGASLDDFRAGTLS